MMIATNPKRPNPFPGLRPFRSDEHHLFFGRETQTAALVQLLRTNRFLAVVGTSGSGKSSLVRAGMIAELHGGTMIQAGSTWEVMILRPGGTPLENLARAFVEVDLYDGEDPSTLPRLLATLSRSRFGLVEAMKQSALCAPGTNLLVVVDQFEELFRFRQQGVDSEETAAAFVNLLLTASDQTECPIYVTITMRSDYLGDCSEIPGLAEAVNEGEYLIPRLGRDQKRDAIEKPIGVGGARIAPLLVQRLLNDVGDDPDQLPVLQHALMRMWDVWSAGTDHERPIDFSDFEATGGLAAALSNHADEVYDALPDDRHRAACARILKTLTVKGDDNRGIRRPTRLAQLQAIAAADRVTMTTVVDAFRVAGVTFLMPGTDVELEERTVLDLSHESLMRCWQRLRGWVEDEAQSARVFRRLLDTARLWGEGKAGLFRDPDLQIALSWRAQEMPNAEWAEQYGGHFAKAIAFLQASNAEAEAERQAKEAARQRALEQAQQLAEARQQRLEQQQRSARKLRKLIAGLAVVAAIAGVACIAALIANQRANTLADIARQNEQRAVGNEEQATQNAQRAEESEKVTAKALATVAAQKADVEDSLSSSLEYFSAALQQADGYEARKPIIALLARFDMVLSAFVERRPVDEQLQLALARRLAERGRKHLAKKQPGAAQGELEQSRAIFTRLLAPSNRWTVQTPIEMKTETGAKMELQKDGSIFVHQDAGGRFDTYTLVFQPKLQGITGLRLDVLADPRLPHGGPGWNKMNGNFALSELTVEAAPADGSDKATTIPLRNAWADFSQLGSDIRAAVDGNPRTSWLIWPQVNKDHTAVFALSEKVGEGAAAQLTVRLIHQFADHNLGRFRLSFTNDAKTLQAPHIRQDLKDGELVDCNIALGTAYSQQGQTKPAIAAFTEALLRTADRAGRGKIIAEAAPLDGVLDKLIARAAGEGRFQAELAQHYAAHGQPGAANAARAKACAWFEAMLAKEPENLAVAAELTQVLLDQRQQDNPRWAVLKPREMKSEGGATLTLQPDGSILASGKNPGRDVYHLVAKTDLKQITAIRLEALPDPSLPRNGPGRFGNGSFHLNKLRIHAGGATLPLTGIVVTHSETADFQNLIDGRTDARIGWSTFPRVGMASTAVLATRLERAADADLKIDLYCSPYMDFHNLGCFRLSVSGDPATFAHESAALKITDPWAKLAAAYAAIGRMEEAAQYFSTALQQAGSYEARQPILELAAGMDGALATLVKRQADDPQLHLALARQHAERGMQRLAEMQPAKAQAELEQARTITTRLLTKYPTPHWTVLQPTEMISKGGATLTLLADGSVLASGTNPARDEYTIVGRPALEKITAIRLEALPDPSLPGNGPGRALGGPNTGNFHLNKIRVFSGGQPCALTNIVVDHPNMMGNNIPSPYQQVIHGPVDSSPGWGNWPRAGLANTAVIAMQVARAAKDDMKIEMVFAQSAWMQHNLGRFRLAVTSAADAINAVELQKRLQNSEIAQWDVALAKAHAQQAHTNEAVALFIDALDRTADPADKATILADAARLDGILEQLAAHVVDDGHSQAELARLLADHGQVPLANAVRAKARAWFEAKLAKEPDNSQSATELAQVLLDEHEQASAARWSVLKPAVMKSAGGATLTLQPDSSILAGGKNPDWDTYTITATPELERIRAIRLEALPDASLPLGGPGRLPTSGTFSLHQFRAFSGMTRIPLTARYATYDQFGQFPHIVDGTIDENAWDVFPRAGQKHTAYFGADFSPPKGDALKFEMHFSRGQWSGDNLGRFRLSVSGDSASIAQEQQHIAATAITDHWARLAAAYRLVGDQPALDRLLKQHPAAAAGVADLFAAVGRTRDGIPYLAQASLAYPQHSGLSLQVAALQAWFGQAKEYAATRQRILASAKGTGNVVTAERAAKACCILPLARKADFEEALALGRTAVELGKSGDWNLLALGMAEYRSENYGAADNALLAAQAGSSNPTVRGIAPFYRAMSLFRLGQTDEARTLATLATATMKPLPANEQNPLADSADDYEDLIVWLAYKEAKALLKIDADPPATWLNRALAQHRRGETDQAKHAAHQAAEMLKLAAGTAKPVAPAPGVPAGKGRAILQVSQNLTAKDPTNCPGRLGYHYKLHPVKLEAGKTYTIAMDKVGQTGLDSYLVLVNRIGQIVAQDDDSGGSQNARIVYKAQESGVFRVYATTFQPGMVGAFRLTVAEDAGAAVGAHDTALRSLLRQTVLALGTEGAEAKELIAAAAGEPPAPLNDAIRQHPDQARGYRDRANWHGRHARWNDAIADFVEAFRRDPTTLDGLRLGILLAWTGEKERYQEHIQAMLRRWALTKDNGEADQVLKTIVLFPDAKADAKQLARLAEAAVAGDLARDWSEWWLVAKALHDLRTGRYADALTACRASRQRAPASKGDPRILTALNLAIEAMALHGAGEADEARRTLEQAQPLVDSHVPGMDPDDWWADWLAAHMLYREAARSILTRQ